LTSILKILNITRAHTSYNGHRGGDAVRLSLGSLRSARYARYANLPSIRTDLAKPLPFSPGKSFERHVVTRARLSTNGL
jgi:hypothetical protein